jgi:hypothetical protein
MVNGAFARAFKAEVQPVEIASALQRELDDRAAIIDRERTIVPNIFHIELSPHDYTRLAVFRDALQGELTNLVKGYATEQRYTLLGTVQIVISQDDDLDTGIFRVRSEARAEVAAKGTTDLDSAAGAAVIAHQPRLEIGRTAYPLVRAVTRIGRGADVDIRIDDPGTSRNHCEILMGSPLILRDLNSTNGTMVQGKRITELPLTEGTAIQIGSTTLVFRNS